MTKQKKLLIIIVSCVLAVALITTAVLLIVANNNREKTHTSILTLSVNPKVQFVLNGNDKVMQVVALNTEGEDIAYNGNFVGLKAEQAAELFIKLSTEAGYIDVDTEGTKVEINITGLKNNYVQIKDKLVLTINNYFDKNGIIAGAVATIDENIKSAILTLKSSAQNLQDKTEEQLIAEYIKITEDIKGIKARELSNFFTSYAQYEQARDQRLKEIEDSIEYWKNLISETTDSALIKIYNENLTTAQNTITQKINDAENDFINRVTDLQQNFGYTQQEITKLNEDFAIKVQSEKAEIEEHLNSFNANKATIEQKIAEYRATLAK